MNATWGQILAAIANNSVAGTGPKYDPLSGFGYFKDFVGIVQSVVTIAALIIGVFWFYRRRRPAPKMVVSHDVAFSDLGHGKKLIRLTATFENKGETLMQIVRCKAWLQQVSPVSPHLLEMLKKDGRIVCEGKAEADWPMLAELTCEPEDTEIEPGESHGLYFDFAVPDNVRSVIAYTYVSNPAKSDATIPAGGGAAKSMGREIGWPTVTFHKETT